MKCAYCRKPFRKASKVLEHFRKDKCGADLRWGKVVELRLAYKNDSANRLARKLLGVATPMSEEKKAELKKYNEEHKEEIAERAKKKREQRNRTLELINQPRRRKAK